MVYGVWLGGRVYSTDADVMSGIVIIALSIVILLQTSIHDHKAEA